MTASRQRQRRLERDVAALRRAMEADRHFADAKSPGKPFLIVLSGLPGTGKSYFARKLTQRLPFLVLASDKLRKALVPSPKYTPGESFRLFAACHRLIAESLAEGYPLIFDATNLAGAHREPLYYLADRMNVPLVMVRFTAPQEGIRQRLEQRGACRQPWDFSDADWLIYRRLYPTEEPIDRDHLTIDTSGEIQTAVEQIVNMVLQS